MWIRLGNRISHQKSARQKAGAFLAREESLPLFAGFDGSPLGDFEVVFEDRRVIARRRREADERANDRVDQEREDAPAAVRAWS